MKLLEPQEIKRNSLPGQRLVVCFPAMYGNKSHLIHNDQAS